MKTLSMNGLICALQKFHLNPHNVRIIISQTNRKTLVKVMYLDAADIAQFCHVLSVENLVWLLASQEVVELNQNKTKNQKDIIIQSNKS